MDDMITYNIQLNGQVNEQEINARSPLQMSLVWVTPNASLVTVCTDQSGIIGLIRHLHNLGLVFLAISRADAGWLCAQPEEDQKRTAENQ
jgi:hypothetical protein